MPKKAKVAKAAVRRPGAEKAEGRPRKTVETVREPAGARVASPAMTLGPLPDLKGQVVIRLRGEKESPGAVREFRFTPSAAMREAAMHWSYVLRNRRRWTNNDEIKRQQERDLTALLAGQGIDRNALLAVARADLVEICIPHVGESDGWELRIFPWEHVLSAVTRELRGDHRFTVVRQLHQAGRVPVAQGEPRRILLVESAPCGVRESFAFDSERRLVRESFKGDGFIHELIIDPTTEALRERVLAFRPDVIHVAGVDTHQALPLLKPELQELMLARFSTTTSGPDRKPRVRDGLLLRDAANGPQPVGAGELGRILCSGHPPMLICFNLQNSAARLASMAVASGAGAAVGFQDDFRDNLAELLFRSLYEAWSREGLQLCDAFCYAWSEVRDFPSSLRGTGVVMWSDRSWVDLRPAAPAPSEASPASPWQRLQQESEVSLRPDVTVLDQITVEIEPMERLNYSMLHNRPRLFKKFLLRKPVGRMRDVTVQVNLHAGPVLLPYRSRFSADKLVEDLGDRINIPLTAALTRSARESVRSTLHVAVAWGDHTLYEHTHRVSLLPVDEWRDDDDDRIWLPSFVLPRDPAVEAIIKDAQGSLKTLVDDSAAGFDGYQSLGDLGLPVADRAEGVDLQVRAIWSALTFFRTLAYINPPPVYTESSQRLRMPGDILRSQSGTCIDLTLLLAACLEYVDIHPVIFLLEGHAFPGYWRDIDAYERFVAVRTGQGAIELTESEDAGSVDGRSTQRYAWYFEKAQYREILQEVYTGNLVPLEAVSLTSQAGFEEAMEEGRNNLRSKAEFHSMIDIMLARGANITPLPVREEER